MHEIRTVMKIVNLCPWMSKIIIVALTPCPSMQSLALQWGRVILGKRTPTSVKRRSSRVDFWWRNPSSPDVVMKALFRIVEPQNRVERNIYFVSAHEFVLALRYLHFFPLLTYMTDSTKYIWRLLFTDGRSQLQRNDIFTKSVKRRILKHRKSSGFLMK